MKAPTAETPFRLYNVAEDAVIGAVLTEVMEGKEHIITYLSRRLIDTEIRYFLLKSCVYFCSMVVPNYDIICYLVLV
jgi:hypothetical protein